jgi:hypothetical protein
MSTNLQVGNTLLTTLLVCGLVACTGQSTSSGGTGGTPAATGGTASAATGGGGAAGATGTVSTDGKLCPPPAGALITDFTPGSGETTQVHFGNSTTFAGGEYTYPAALTSDVTGGDWHISGTVGDYSGFGLYFDNCTTVDASAYKGISFKVSGDAGAFGGITFGVDTLNDSVSAAWLNSHGSTDATNPGRCTPPADPTLNQYTQQVCANSTASIPVTAAPVTQTILWADFTGGKPKTVEPAEITGIHWNFTWTDGGAYDVNIHIDDLSFVP